MPDGPLFLSRVLLALTGMSARAYPGFSAKLASQSHGVNRSVAAMNCLQEEARRSRFCRFVTGQLRLALPMVCLAWLGSAAAVAQQAQRVSGVVTDFDTGEPVGGATVALIWQNGTMSRALTGLDGAFAISGIEPGDHVLRLQRIGYEVLDVPLTVGSDPLEPLVVRLRIAPVVLDPIETVVPGRPGRLVDAGFFDRMEVGWGDYFDPAWVERNSAGHVTAGRLVESMLRSASSVCGPQVPVYVDGVRSHGAHADLDELSAADLLAAEIYPDANGVPLFAFDDETWGCGAVILWTRSMLAGGSVLPRITIELCEPVGVDGTVSIEGVVADEVTGIRLPTARVRVARRPQAARTSGEARIVADRDGRYRVCDVESGTPLELSPAFGRVVGPTRVITAGSGSDYLLTVPVTVTASVSGMVVSKIDARRLHGARVTLLSTDHRTVTNEGRFTLLDVPTGRYQLEVTCGGFRPASSEVVVAAKGMPRILIELVSVDGVARYRCDQT